MFAEIKFPFTHNLAKLVGLCETADASFSSLILTVEPLTPYAVEMRYDNEFWPSQEVAQEAIVLAGKVRDFVLQRLRLILPE